jgi:hypothetical protein
MAKPDKNVHCYYHISENGRDVVGECPQFSLRVQNFWRGDCETQLYRQVTKLMADGYRINPDEICLTHHATGVKPPETA